MLRIRILCGSVSWYPSDPVFTKADPYLDSVVWTPGFAIIALKSVDIELYSSSRYNIGRMYISTYIIKWYWGKKTKGHYCIRVFFSGVSDPDPHLLIYPISRGILTTSPKLHWLLLPTPSKCVTYKDTRCRFSCVCGEKSAAIGTRNTTNNSYGLKWPHTSTKKISYDLLKPELLCLSIW